MGRETIHEFLVADRSLFFFVSVTYTAGNTEFCGDIRMTLQRPFLSLWRNASLRVPSSTARVVPRRKFGSGLPHIKDQNRATLFNENLPKNGTRKWEVGLVISMGKYK